MIDPSEAPVAGTSQNIPDCHNALLLATQKHIESNLVGRTRDDYQKVVKAGMHAALKGGPNSIIAGLKESKNPIHDCVIGAINLTMILRKQSRNTMPLQALVPGATVLMLHALDFGEMMGIVHIDKPELDQATHLLANTLLHRMGLTPAMLSTASDKVHSLMRDPANVERMKYAAGMTKNPNSPVPTLLPSGEGEGEPGEAAQ